MQIEVLVGMIASGKSTYARRRSDEGALVVCHDDLTEMLHGGVYRYEQGLRDCYRQMEQSLAWAALVAGRDVVIDRTHLAIESRGRWIMWACQYDSLQDYERAGTQATSVVAVTFPIESPAIHARRRFEADPRGRSYEDWLAVATHHHEQAAGEPLGNSEGFTRIIQGGSDA